MNIFALYCQHNQRCFNTAFMFVVFAQSLHKAYKMAPIWDGCQCLSRSHTSKTSGWIAMKFYTARLR